MEEREGARGDGRDRAVLAAVVVAMLVPYVVAAVAAARDGWVPIDDSVTMVVGSRDTFTLQTPLLGLVSSGRKYGIPAFNPGPLPFWVNAPFVHLFGGTAGMLIGTVAQAAICLTGIAAAAHRIGGRGRALWALTVTGALIVGVGGMSFLFDPALGSSTLLPLVLLLVASWAALSGAPRWFALVVAVGSLVAQSDLGFAPLPLVAGAGCLVALVRRGEFRRRAVWGPSVAAFLVAWGGPLLELVRGDGNIAAMWRAAGKATGQVQGVGSALAVAGRALTWTTPDSRTADAAARSQPVLWFLATTVVVALVAVGWRRAGRPERTAVLVAAIGLVVTVGTHASVPGDEAFILGRLFPVVAAAGFAWFAAGAVAATRLPARPRSTVPAALLPVALAAASCVPLPLQPGTTAAPSAWAAGPALADRLAPVLERDVAYDVAPSGAVSVFVTSAVLAGQLEERGVRTTLIPRSTPLVARHVPSGGTLVVASTSAPAPPGSTLLATYRPPGWSEARSRSTAAAVAEFADEHDVTLTDMGTASLPGLLCPGASACPAADDPTPDWALAVMYAQQFDPYNPFELLHTPRLPDALLERLRADVDPTELAVYRMAP